MAHGNAASYIQIVKDCKRDIVNSSFCNVFIADKMTNTMYKKSTRLILGCSSANLAVIGRWRDNSVSEPWFIHQSPTLVAQIGIEGVLASVWLVKVIVGDYTPNTLWSTAMGCLEQVVCK